MLEVQTTINYDLFKKLEGNRTVTQKRIESIKQSILKVGYLHSPILVNEKYEIIDGQGRFEALKSLKLPIEYIMQSEIGIKECISMNIHQSNWNVIDYIKSYAEKNVQSFIYIDEIMKKYNITNTSIISVSLFGTNRFNTKDIRNGTIEITEEQYNSAINRLEYFKEIVYSYKQLPRINLLLQGLLFCTFIKEVDLNKLKNKVLDILLLEKLPPIPTMDDVMQFLEEVYNKNNRSTIVYIYTEYRKMQIEKIIHRKKVNDIAFKYISE